MIGWNKIPAVKCRDCACIVIGALAIREGAMLRLDGNEGHVHAGATEISEQVPGGLVARLDDLHRKQVVGG
jgi:hypothetical protein